MNAAKNFEQVYKVSSSLQLQLSFINGRIAAVDLLLASL